MSKLPNPPDGGYWYGVATSLMDGAGVAHIAGIAANDKYPPGNPARFRFSVFRVQATGLSYLPLEDEAAGLTGAGEIYTRGDGQGRYRCTSNKIAYDGPIPGFVPIPASVPGPPGPPGPAGSGGVTLFPAPRTSPQWEGRTLSAGVLVDIPATFGVPSAQAYLVRFAAKASAADVRARAGSQAAPFFLTVVTQAPNIEVHTQGWVNGPSVWLSAVGGAATVWLQVEGYS